MKTLKTEEVDGWAYSDLDHAGSCVGDFIEQVYNRTRLHSALDYRSPMEFEDQTIWAGVRHGYGDSALNAANPLSFDQSRCAAP